MLVSHRYKFIYTKTVKTAGTSVEMYFEPYCVKEGISWKLLAKRADYVSEDGIIGHRGGGRDRTVRWWNHMPAAVIRRQLGEGMWNSYFKFCVIRNPYTRLISLFYFLVDRGEETADTRLPLPLQFERWLEQRGSKIGKDRMRYFVDGVFCMDEVIRFENLSADMERICVRIGVPWEPERLSYMKSGIRPRDATPERLYTDKARRMVEQACAFELEKFGYSFPTSDE